MKRPKIKTALSCLFGLLAVVFSVFAFFSVQSLQSMNHMLEQISTDTLPSVQLAKEADTALSDLRIAYNMHILAVDDAGEKEAVAAVTREDKRLHDTINAYAALVKEEGEQARIGAVLKALDEYASKGKQMLTLSSAQDDDGAKRVLQTEMRPITQAVAGKIDEMVNIHLQEAEEAHTAGAEAFKNALTVALSLSVLAIMAAVGAMLFARRSIASPIESITQAMNGLAAGETDKNIPYGGRADEIGKMAQAVEVFRQNALTKMEMEFEAERQRSLSDQERQAREEQDRRRAQAMAQATTGLASGLKHLASGDLAFQLTDRFAEEFESLRADFNQAVDQLRTTLASVADATGSIDGGSREISRSADDLSKRTEQQAASLEETAAALDEITANVSNSSQRAEEARVVAVQANESARKSGLVVSDAVSAMSKIEQSSNQISSIIGVIDEIAFQTNLLALNAGVEAARAGEAGKGFAVVAQEVRELAQRSAQAAKEIKDLIRNSSGEVQNGVKLVSQTGEALKTIEMLVVTINQHMESIATSAREQSIGLSEVNTAVNQMDQVTQQNAAMVEETNAAGATLASEATRLKELVDRFQFGGAAAYYSTPAIDSAASLASPARRAPAAAAQTARAVPSPARSMVSRIASSFGARSAAAAAPAGDNWEEF
ncbi:methyl-accepting chemotaxis protein [Rhizobium sp. YIM 134829]|uniref:HAMP domain-containing methyl-accepting chemotaxis protein n=1 Tax=Rhizobium sp. YIM 134829 TaxID=3390453 RepID=UPI00397C5AEF